MFSVLLGLCAVVGAAAQDSPKGLSKDQVVKLLKEDPPARVQYLVNKYGVAFSLTPDIEKELTQAGASPELLDLVRKLAPAKPAEVKAPPPPAPPVLVINAKPGDAEVYVDDERRGQTSAGGALRVNGLTPGSHQLRLSLSGYRSFEINIELNPGETNTVVAKLLPVEPPPAAPKQEPAASGATPQPQAKVPSDPNNPLAPHDPGIYFVLQKGNEHQLIELDQAPSAGRSAGASRGRALAGFGGGGVKWKSMIYGSKARIRVPGGRPVFYFYFSSPETYGGNSDLTFRPSATPNSFLLVHLDSKKNEREIPAKGSVTSTVQAKDLIPFDYEKVGAGIYKVQLKSDLGPGEFGFLLGGVLQAMGEVWLYDFGVDGGK